MNLLGALPIFMYVGDPRFKRVVANSTNCKASQSKVNKLSIYERTFRFRVSSLKQMPRMYCLLGNKNASVNFTSKFHPEVKRIELENVYLH